MGVAGFWSWLCQSLGGAGGGQTTAPNNDPVQWEKVLSTKGVPFEVTEDAVVANSKPAALTKKPFGISVNWALGGDGWKDAGADVKETAGITQYRLYKYTGILYGDYILEFTNTEDYDYQFFDQTGDDYGNNTSRLGDHAIRYKSDKPSILFIRGR